MTQTLIFCLFFVLVQISKGKYVQDNFDSVSLTTRPNERLFEKYMTNEELKSFCKDLTIRFPRMFKIHNGLSRDFMILEMAQHGGHLPILRPAVRLFNDRKDGQGLTNALFARTAFDFANNYETDYNNRWLVENTRIFFIFSKVVNDEKEDCEYKNSFNVNPLLAKELEWLDLVKKSSLDVNVYGGGLGSNLLPYPVDENTLGLRQLLSRNISEEYWLNYKNKKDKVSNIVEASRQESKSNENIRIDLRVSLCRIPPESHLDEVWQNNEDSIRKVLARVHDGVKGQLVNDLGISVGEAKLKIRGTDLIFSPDRNTGEFFQILPSGRYMLDVTARGYRFQEVSFSVDNLMNTAIVDIVLTSVSPSSMRKTLLQNRQDVPQIEERTPVYVPKIPKNVYESILNGLNLLNLLTPLKMALG